MSPAEKRGEKIYFTGVGSAGEPVEAFFGVDRIPVFGELAICSSCHGYDGLGRPESGILPSNITWQSLTKSYGHIHASGLHHPPYDETSLKHLLRDGVFPGGEPVDPSMPVYSLSDDDLADLLAYLKRLGTLRDPGVDAKRLRIGMLSSVSGTTAETLNRVVAGSVAPHNASGGLYDRQIELVPISIQRGDMDLESLTAQLVSEDLFALVTPFTPGAEDVLWKAARAIDIPVIAPYSLYPPTTFNNNRNVFSLFPGIDGQVRQLKNYLSATMPAEKKVAIVYESDKSLHEVAEALRQTWRGSDWAVVEGCSLTTGGNESAACAEKLSRQGVECVIFLGFQESMTSFLSRAAAVGWAPYVLSSGSLAGSAPAAAGNFEGELLLSYPTLARDRLKSAEQKMKKLAGEVSVSAGHVQASVTAAVGAGLLVDALQKSGRELDRRKLVTELEKLYRYETGLTPPLTFTSNRRVGSEGIYVVRRKVDPQNKQADFSFEWFESP